jgi:hypothetical protein
VGPVRFWQRAHCSKILYFLVVWNAGNSLEVYTRVSVGKVFDDFGSEERDVDVENIDAIHPSQLLDLN